MPTARRRSALPLPAALLLPVLLGLLTACGGAADPEGSPEPSSSPTAVEQVSQARIRPGDEIPRPRGRVVLTLTGVPNTNVGTTLQFDLETLDSLGVVSYEVDDRQAEGRVVEFSGPLLRTVLDAAGARGKTLHGVALNDYAVDVPSSDAYQFPVMLATRADGQRMTVARYGPTRFVYPTKGYDLDKSTYDPRWIWQLARIDVR